ncbi:hypothetical protein ACJMK2_011366 [Sinanodonta woodiana]|uniref:Large ribosomal subunit protein mL50 n=1 Tax=Sinanodonta woodiana TaxID=1069815 RepID=A0ABD3V650_SINWO
MSTCTKCLRVVQITNLLLRPSSTCFFKVLKRTAFFKRKEKKEETKSDIRKPQLKFDGPLANDAVQILKKRTSIETVKAYNPPADVESRVQKAAIDVLGGDQTNWKKIPLEDRTLKFKFLAKLTKEFDHNIPNRDLNSMQNVQTALDFFRTRVHDTSAYEDLSKLDLPKNLHMNLEPIRFDPETDTIFGGKTAFPGRPTIVTSIKYRRKYKGCENKLKDD